MGAAYAVAGLVLLALVVWAVRDYRAQRAALDAIEGRGQGWRGRPDAAARPADPAEA